MTNKINIIDILKENGYEIVKQYDMRLFRLKFTPEEVEKKKAESNNWGYDLESCFNVEIRGVGFNGNGNLYICLDCVGGDDPEFKKGDTFDVIEYE